MIDEKIARVKGLIEQREKIDAELAVIFGMSESPKRGRPRKKSANGAGVHADQNAPHSSVEPISDSDGA